jgi:hypothetical protein
MESNGNRTVLVPQRSSDCAVKIRAGQRKTKKAALAAFSLMPLSVTTLAGRLLVVTDADGDQLALFSSGLQHAQHNGKGGDQCDHQNGFHGCSLAGGAVVLILIHCRHNWLIAQVKYAAIVDFFKQMRNS